MSGENMFDESIVEGWELDGLGGGSEAGVVSTDGVSIVGGCKRGVLGGGSESGAVSTDGVSIIGG